MIKSIFYPRRTYPYLAVWVGKGGTLDEKQIANIDMNEIVLISMVTVKENEEQADKQPYVQYLFGGKEGYVTKYEDEYYPLPNGFVVEIRQSAE